MSNKYGSQRQRQNLLVKCVTNPQHNTPDKKLYGYGSANIAEELNFRSSE